MYTNTPMIERTIVLSDITVKNEQIKIKDENGNLYSFFKNKKDGTKSKAMLTAGGLKKGMTVEILFREVPYRDGSINSIVKFNRDAAVEQRSVQPTPQLSIDEDTELSVEDIPF